MIERDNIYHMDCLVGLMQMKDRSVDLVVTDCPYKIIESGKPKFTNKGKKMGGIFDRDNKNIADNVCSGKIYDWNDIEYKRWLPHVYRVLKEDTHCYIMINSRNLKELWHEAERVGFKFQNLIIWDKGNATPNRWYMQSFECILMLRKGQAKSIRNTGTTNILRVPNIIGNKKHPTEKPVRLMQVLIENSSNKGDLVLDSFMGSASTAVACVNLERHYLGFEIDEKYYNIGINRLKRESRQLNLFDEE